MDLTKQFKELRIARKYTQQEIADAINVTQAQLSLVEGGRRGMSETLLKKLSEFYKVPYQFFLFKTIKEKDVPKKHREQFVQIQGEVENLFKKIIDQ